MHIFLALRTAASCLSLSSAIPALTLWCAMTKRRKEHLQFHSKAYESNAATYIHKCRHCRYDALPLFHLSVNCVALLTLCVTWLLLHFEGTPSRHCALEHAAFLRSMTARHQCFSIYFLIYFFFALCVLQFLRKISNDQPSNGSSLFSLLHPPQQLPLRTLLCQSIDNGEKMWIKTALVALFASFSSSYSTRHINCFSLFCICCCIKSFYVQPFCQSRCMRVAEARSFSCFCFVVEVQKLWFL